MKKNLLILLFFGCILPCSAKDGSISLLASVKTQPYIFGGILLEKTEVKKEVFYTVLVKDIIKGKIDSDTIQLKFMYQSEGRNMVHKNGSFVIGLVDQHSGGRYYESAYIDHIIPLPADTVYHEYVSYIRQAYGWVYVKNLFKKQQLKSDWVATYISHPILGNELLFEFLLYGEEYGVMNRSTQEIVKNEIMLHFDKNLDYASYIKTLSGKYKREVLEFILSKLDANNPANSCPVMEMLWYVTYPGSTELYTIWSSCCEQALPSVKEYEDFIEAFKKEARRRIR